ncbi:retrovirus-related Pol polyprotein from transposon 412 [Trichonephila clavipes]|nr:retrovirus-related Pol polyprotein from transposon 412 [Trichonephila clavipes]
MVERFNRTILNSLSLLVSNALRKISSLPADLLFSRSPDAPLVPEEYIEKLQARMEEMLHLARERTGMASEKMKTRYDARATGHDFHEGNFGIQAFADDLAVVASGKGQRSEINTNTVSDQISDRFENFKLGAFRRNTHLCALISSRRSTFHRSRHPKCRRHGPARSPGPRPPRSERGNVHQHF